MHEVGDQWIETIDGQEHMVKAVKITRNSWPVDNGFRDGYFFTNNKIVDEKYSYYEVIKAKDLGIVNEDGCLPNCWGEYPHVEGVRDTKTWVVWYRCVTRIGMYCTTDSYKTKEEAIDEWNRRG